MTKTIFAVVIAAVVAGGVYGGYKFLFAPAVGGTSSSSVSFNTAKYAATGGISLASPGTAGATGANGTSTSILNTDGTDRYVTGIRSGCEGVGTSKTAYTGTGLSALLLTISTSSTSGPSSFPSGGNKVGGTDFTIPTTTANSLVASSTGSVSTTSIVWAPATYLNFQTNATNTATCTFGADYIGS